MALGVKECGTYPPSFILVFHLGHYVMSAGLLFISLFDFVIVEHVTIGH